MFGSKTCFFDLRKLALPDFWAIHYKGSSSFLPSLPFIRGLGSICINPRSARLNVSSSGARNTIVDLVNVDPSQPLEITANPITQDDFYGPLDCYWNEFFGYDPTLEDQRMFCLYFELTRPLFLRGSTDSDVRAEGKVFIHIYPSGYIALCLAVALTWQDKRPIFNLHKLIQETRPWRKDTTWTWASVIGRGTLADLTERVKVNLHHSLFIDRSLRWREGQWHTAIKLVSDADAKQCSSELLMTRGECEALDLQNYGAASLKYLVASRQGLVCVVAPLAKRNTALRLFWKILALYEFVNLKQRIYDDYASFLRNEVGHLRDFRLSLKRKVVKEDVLRFSVYDHKIPLFLSALDNYIKVAAPFHRRIYSAISTGVGFDERRIKVKMLVEEWNEEISKWEHGLLILWKKIISPLRSLLASK